MWIKVKAANNKDILINSDQLKVILPNTEDSEGCDLYFNEHGIPFKVKTTFNQIEMLLDINSIEKCIDRLKIENAQLEQKMQYDKIHAETYGARAHNKGGVK